MEILFYFNSLLISDPMIQYFQRFPLKKGQMVVFDGGIIIQYYYSNIEM